MVTLHVQVSAVSVRDNNVSGGALNLESCVCFASVDVVSRMRTSGHRPGHSIHSGRVAEFSSFAASTQNTKFSSHYWLRCAMYVLSFGGVALCSALFSKRQSIAKIAGKDLSECTTRGHTTQFSNAEGTMAITNTVTPSSLPLWPPVGQSREAPRHRWTPQHQHDSLPLRLLGADGPERPSTALRI